MPTDPPLWYPKPKPRQAVIWTGDYNELPLAWRKNGALTRLPDGTLRVLTNHGMVRAEIGDYIARDLAGTFYPVKASTFEATYERRDQ